MLAKQPITQNISNLKLIYYVTVIILILNVGFLVAFPLYFFQDKPIKVFLKNLDFIKVALLTSQILALLYLNRVIKKRSSLKDYFESKSISLKKILLWSTFVLSVNYFFSYFLNIENNTLNKIIMEGNKFLAVVSVVFVAPILEELLFRGFLFKELIRKYSD